MKNIFICLFTGSTLVLSGCGREIDPTFPISTCVEYGKEIFYSKGGGSYKECVKTGIGCYFPLELYTEVHGNIRCRLPEKPQPVQ